MVKDMVKKQTTVMVDVEKWALAKSKGYKLQDLVDMALDNILSINRNNSKSLQEEKEDILEDLMLLKKDKEETLQKLDNDINELELRLSLINEKINKNRQQEIQDQVNDSNKMEWNKERNLAFREVCTILDSMLSQGKDPDENTKVQSFKEKYGLTTTDLNFIYQYPNKLSEVVPYDKFN